MGQLLAAVGFGFFPFVRQPVLLLLERLRDRAALVVEHATYIILLHIGVCALVKADLASLSIC